MANADGERRRLRPDVEHPRAQPLVVEDFVADDANNL
jgi:hypothetical protein